MKTPPASLRLGLAATAALLAAATAPAQSVVTDPVGFTTLTVAAKPANSRGFSYLALNMFRPTAFRSVVPTGGVSAAGSNTVLTFPANSFTAGQFAGAGNAFFLEIKNGTSAGVLADVVSNTTNTITLAEDISALITAGTTTIGLRPHWTFGTAFGTANSAGFLPGTASTGDTVSLINSANGAYTLYYYSPNNGGRWQTGLSTPANDVIIRPDIGFLVERKVTSAFSFTVVGEVKLGPTELTVVGGGTNGNYSILPNPYPLTSKTLAQSGLYTGNAATGVVAGTASTGDLVSIFNPANGAFTNYYYSPNNGGRWQTGLNTDASTVTIPEGASVVVFRRAGNGSFSWFVPQPTMNL